MEHLADALERDLQANPVGLFYDDRRQLLTWLRFRQAKWATRRRLDGPT